MCSFVVRFCEDGTMAKFLERMQNDFSSREEMGSSSSEKVSTIRAIILFVSGT